MEQKQGFRSGRGTTDWIYIVKCIYQITDKMKKPAYVLFIDLAAAFDKEDRDLMFKTVLQRLTKDLHSTDPANGITMFTYSNRTSSNSG